MIIDNDISEFITPRSEEQSFPSELFYESDKTVIEKIRIHGKWHLIKRIAKDYEFSPQHRTSLEREFEIGFHLDHSNIVRYIDKKYNDNGVPYLILEYIDGCTLRDLMLKPQGLNDFEFAKCFKTILETLIYLHKHQIYHLDIKPENIVITHKEHNVKLIDFGFAESDSFGQPLGCSLHYKAPEFNGDVSLISGKTDMYSFALSMKELYETALVSMPRKYKTVISKSLNNDASKRIDAEKALEIITIKSEVRLWLLILPLFLILVFFVFNKQTQTSEIKPIIKANQLAPISLLSNSSSKQGKEENTTTNKGMGFSVVQSKKEWRESFDRIIKEGNKNITVSYSDVDSAKCISVGKILLSLYANEKQSLKKWDRLKLKNRLHDSLYSEFQTYQKKWNIGTATFVYYSDLWSKSINLAEDSINKDIFGQTQ